MATGVPETDVFQAADAVLARGERPTVERVRIQLGRGSPARVGQLLEQWWEQLAQRLKGHALLPELPSETAQAFAEVWRGAVAHAETTARAALTEEQNALFAEQTTLNQERKLWEIALAEAQTQVAEAIAQRAQGDAQLRERQVLVDQLEAQHIDLVQQRNRLQAHADQQHAELTILRDECTAMQAHVRMVEDRAHQQVDHAREETKTLQQRLEKREREHDKRAAQLLTQHEALRTAVRAAEQATAHHAGRVAALEAAVAQWRTPTSRPSRQASKSNANPLPKPVRGRKRKA